jgi:hypothetical protein
MDNKGRDGAMYTVGFHCRDCRKISSMSFEVGTVIDRYPKDPTRTAELRLRDGRLIKPIYCPYCHGLVY